MHRMFAWLAVAMVALSGCSNDGDTAPADAATPSASSGPAAQPLPRTASPIPGAVPTSPTATAAERPFTDYSAPGNDAVLWVALYYALSGTPVDYSAVAARLDPRYQQTSDAFEQRDALAALKARLDPAIAAAKASPYVQMPPVLMHRPTYDVVGARYDLTPLVGPQHRFTVAGGNVRVGLATNPGLVAYFTANEAEARTLEQAMNANPMAQVQVTVYGKAVAAAAIGGTPQVMLVPTRIVVENAYVDGSAKPLFTATATP